MNSQGQPGLLAQSRFQRPRFGDDVMPLPRLFALLAEPRSLTLVSAPDSYPKTVLVSTWLETIDVPHSWLTLDASHNDPNVFAAYFLAAVRKLAPDVGRELQALLVSSTPAPALVADYLLAELDGFERPMVVLDNYHEIERSEVHAVVSRVARHLPRAMRLVLITRRDPPFSLTSLRAYGLLREVRTNALRFTPEEATIYLQRKLGAQANDETIQLLLTMAEGWIAGLHLMALHLQGRQDDSAAIRNLQNADRFATEYLAIEVLRRQSLAIQDFLVKTSILDTFSASLCAATIGVENGIQVAEHLAFLRSNNLFTYEIGNQPGWYRYQQLFRHVLSEHLHTLLSPVEVAALHSRAYAWYAAAGMIDAALAHAEAVGDMAAAVRLVAESRHELMNREEWHTLHRLLNLFDHDTVRNQPHLLLAQAWIHVYDGRLADCGPVLNRIDQLLGRVGADSLIDADALAIERLRTEADVIRTELLLVTVHPHEAIALGQATLSKAPVSWQTAASFLVFSLAGAYQMIGDPARANAVLSDALDRPYSYPSVFHVRVLAAQCMLQWVAADLPAMLRTTMHLQSLADQLHLAEMRSWASFFAGSIYYQWGEMERAEKVLRPVVRQPSAVNGIAFASASCILASIYQIQGRAADASAVTAKAIDLLNSTGSHMLPTLYAFAAELALRQGDLKTATQWAIHEGGQFVPTPGFYWLAPVLSRPRVLCNAARSRAGAAPCATGWARPRFCRCRGAIASAPGSIDCAQYHADLCHPDLCSHQT